MTVSTSYAPLSFSGNGATTAFAVTWPFFDSSLVVTLVDSTGVETVKTITTHYTVSGGTDSDGLPATGTVTMLTAPASGETLRITRNTSKVQSSSWTNGGAYQAKTLEATLDKIILIAQETQAGINDGITGDVMQLNTSGATDYWDAESQIIRNVANATASTDAVNYATLQAEMVAAGSADVVGPATATDNAIARFDATTGKIIQSSSVVVDDSGNVTGAANLPIRVTSIAALKALDTSVYSVAFLSLGSRSGLFEFRSGDYSSQVTADTLNGVYAKADDTASASGAWVRVYSGFKNVKWFGAVGDGSTNDTAACVGAIAALDADGDTLYWPAGTYMVDPDALVIGDGSNLASSTINAITLVGEGSAPYATKGTIIKARGSGSVLIEYAGLINGCRLDGIHFDCNSVCQIGIRMYTINTSTFKNFAVTNFTSYGVFGDCREYGSGSVGWSSNNVFEQFYITSSDVADYGAGFLLDGYYAGNYDWFRNEFRIGVIQINGGSVNPTYGIYLAFCDSNQWFDVDALTVGGTGYSVVFTGDNNAQYPQNNYFYQCSFSDGTLVSGTIAKNYFIGHTTKDSEPTPSDANLIGFTDEGTFFGDHAFAGLVDLSGSAAGQIKFPATQNASADANTLDDYEEGSTTPTVTASSGTFTTVSAALYYTKIGRLVNFSATITITDVGTAAGLINLPLPFTAAQNSAACGRDTVATGVALAVSIAASGASASIAEYDGTPAINNTTLMIQGQYIS